jgi:hypothetical protein
MSSANTEYALGALSSFKKIFSKFLKSYAVLLFIAVRSFLTSASFHVVSSAVVVFFVEDSVPSNVVYT